MKKIYSLTKKEEFNNVIKKGKRIKKPTFNIFYINSNKENKIEEFKIGISIPKRYGNSVFRNKYKRRIKNILNDDDVYKTIKVYIVIVVNKNFFDTDFLESKQLINKAISSIF